MSINEEKLIKKPFVIVLAMLLMILRSPRQSIGFYSFLLFETKQQETQKKLNERRLLIFRPPLENEFDNLSIGFFLKD